VTVLLKTPDGKSYALQCIDCGKVYPTDPGCKCACGGNVMCVTSAENDPLEIFQHVGQAAIDPMYRQRKKAEYLAAQSASTAA
jgi:hypothetical protein